MLITAHVYFASESRSLSLSLSLTHTFVTCSVFYLAFYGQDLCQLPADAEFGSLASNRLNTDCILLKILDSSIKLITFSSF